MARSNTITVELVGDSSKLKRALNQGAQDVESFGSKAGRFAKKAGAALALAGVAIAGAGVVVGKSLFDTGVKLEALRKKSETVFGDQIKVVRRWADENAAAMGLTSSEAEGLAASFGDLLIPMGFTREEAAKMSTDVIGLSGALSEWSGGQVSAAEAGDILAKAMLGERDGLKQLGISISEADVQQRLLEKGQKDLTGAALEQAKAVATQELVFEKSADAQAAYADGAGSLQRKQAELTAKLKEVRDMLAERLIPVFHSLAGFVTDTLIPVAERMGELWGPVLSEAFRGAGTAISKWWKDTVKPALEAFYDAIQDNWPTIEQIWKNFGDIVRSVAQIFGREVDNMSSHSEHGTDSIAADVRNLTIALERFTAFVAFVARNVAGSWDFLAGAVKFDAEQMMRGIDQLTNGAYGRFRSGTRGTVDYAISWFRRLRDGVVAIAQALIRYVSGIPSKISGAFSRLPNIMYDMGKKIIGGLTNGIRAAAGSIGSSIGGAVGSAVKALNPFGDGYGLGGGAASGYKNMFARVAAAFPGTRLLSGLRPGARTATGNRSYHSMGRAVDLPPSMAIFRWIKANFGARTKELIFSPAGRGQLHNGRPHFYGEPTRGDHWDHVHWAMAQGGIVRRRPGGIIANIGEGRHDEAVIPLPRGWQDGGGIGTTININGPIHVECDDAHGLVRELEMMGVRARAG